MRKAFFLACLLAAGAAGAQNTPEQKRPEEKRTEPAPAPRLNLKLDNPAQFVREAPPPDPAKGAETLPSLGGNAMTLERTPTRSERPSPFPKDSETNR